MKHVDRQLVAFDGVIDYKTMSSVFVVDCYLPHWNSALLANFYPYYWGKADPGGRLLTMMTGEWRLQRIRNYPTQLCLLLDHMPVLPLSVPTSLAGSIITVQVGTFSRQLAVAGLR